MVPELNGKPKSFTIKISIFPKNAKVYGNNNLKMNNKMATIIMLAMIKFLMVMVFQFLK